MGSASLQFIGFGLLVVLIFNLNRSVLWRQAVLLIASICFLLFFSTNALAWLPLACFLLFGFASVRMMQSKATASSFAVLVVAAIATFVWLKKYSFVPSPLFLRAPYITLGLSYIFFRVLHLIIEAKDGAIPRKVSLVSYLNYTLNFTTLLSGPIQRYDDFASMQLAPVPLRVDAIVAGQAFERIIVGFFKVNVLSLLFSTIQQDALASIAHPMPLAYRIAKGVVIAASYPVYLYCNFSGYIDVVIGLARLLRIELPENFNRPFSSDNFMNFWSRWHITLSQWLKTYVYNPLLITLMRRYSQPEVEPFLGVFAFFVTFFLVGVWHGQTSEFLFFGVLQGGGVSAVKLYQILITKRLGRKRYKALANNPIYNAFARGLTFTWFAFTLLWFWSNWTQLGVIWNRLGAAAAVLGLFAIFFGATLILELWERIRGIALSWKWDGDPVLTTRYARTVWDTAIAVIGIVVVALLNAPAPEIVYKGF